MSTAEDRVTQKQAAEILGVSYERVRQMVKEGVVTIDQDATISRQFVEDYALNRAKEALERATEHERIAREKLKKARRELERFDP